MFPPGGGATAQVVPSGSTATYYVDVTNTPGSASSPITLSIAGAPALSAPVFNPQPVYSGFGSTLSVGTTAGTTPPGVYALSVSGTNVNGVTHAGDISTLAVTAPPAIPVQLVSQSNSGAQANTGGTVASNSLSASSRLVVFSSTSTNLSPGATAGNPEVYVRDLQASTTTLVSISNSGAVADSWCYGGNISADGNFVEFSSLADNLYPGSILNAVSGIYVRDLTHGATEREDLAPDGIPSNGNSTLGVISGDGRFVAFISTATNLISGGSGTQAYLRDRKTGETVLISSAPDGTAGNGNTSSLAISADGRYVGFVSNATNLVSANTGGLYQAFVRDMVNGMTSLVSSSSSGTPANSSVIDDAGAYPPAISADGRYIAFSSYATNLVPQPTNGNSSHNFVYDRQTQQMSLVDVDSVGTPLGVASYIDAAMSTDGRFIAFYGFDQVLVRDTVESQTAVVSLAVSGQAGNNSTWGWNIGLGGSGVVFASTATNLVSNDSNNAADVFVASNPFVGSVSLNSVSLGTPSIAGGSVATGTVTLTNPAPAGGATVSVWSNNAAAQPPAEVMVPAGATSVPITFSTSLIQSETVMTIMASYNGGSSVAVLTLEPTPELAVSPSTWDFGYQAVGTTTPTESFVLTNSGTAALVIDSIRMYAGQAYSISANTCGSSIAPGGSCSVSIVFKPSTSGTTSDALQISFGSPAATQSITLTGIGAVPSAAPSPGTMNFGSLTVSGSSNAIATLTNSGSAALSGTSVRILGQNSSDFSLSSDDCTGVTLPSNSSCLLTVSFSPQGTGTRQATLSVADNASGSPQIVSLTGTGVSKVTPTILVSPSSSSINTAQLLTATVSVNGGSGNATPTGTVTLTSGSYTSTATTLSSGSATINVPAGSLPTGADTLAASYSGDADYSATTGTASVTVTTAVSPSFTVSGTAVTISPGATTGNTSTITVTPAGGFTGSVVLTAAITGNPTGAQYPPTLSFGSTSPVSITGSTAGTATLTVSTTAATSSALAYPKSPIGRWYTASGAALACILLFGIPVRRRRWRTMLGMLVLLVTLAGGVLACGGMGSGGGSGGGGTSNPGTTAGTYTVTVTATSGSTTATGTVILTVQ
ncbi:MAG: beta strand repeat-containing protein [Sulfobacillus sp.]